MRFNKLDLNLLVALDVLLHEQSISRSAVRLHVTQPAMSNALGRLRDYYDDDLLVQVGRRMELTPFAETLKEAVHDVLLRVNSTITSRPKFEPAESEREFRVFFYEEALATLMPSVLARARAANAKVRFAFLPQLEDPDGALSRGEVDVVVLRRTTVPSNIRPKRCTVKPSRAWCGTRARSPTGNSPSSATPRQVTSSCGRREVATLLSKNGTCRSSASIAGQHLKPIASRLRRS